MEKNKGIESDLIIEDDLEYLTKLYGKTKFSEIWESCKPKLNSSNIDFGKIICFGTCGEINKLTYDRKIGEFRG